MKFKLLLLLLLFSFVLQAQNDSLNYKIVIEKGISEPQLSMDFKDTFYCYVSYEIPVLKTTDSIFLNDFWNFFKVMRSLDIIKKTKVDFDRDLIYNEYGNVNTIISFQSNTVISIEQTSDEDRTCFGGNASATYKIPFSYHITQHKVICFKDVFLEYQIIGYEKYIECAKKMIYDYADPLDRKVVLQQAYNSVSTIWEKPILISEQGITFYIPHSPYGPSRYYDIPIFIEFETYKDEFQPWILEVMGIE